MKPITSWRRSVISPSERPVVACPWMLTVPVVGTSMQPMRLRMVDLPDPERPGNGNEVAPGDGEAHVVQGHDLGLAQRIDLRHVVETDDGIGTVAHNAFLLLSGAKGTFRGGAGAINGAPTEINEKLRGESAARRGVPQAAGARERVR